MLAVLMYHDVTPGGGKYANDPAMLQAHLEYLREHHPVILPGDALVPGKLNVCLTFDDAHVSFYHAVYPLLTQLGLKAVIGVSTDFVLERTDVPLARRLETSSQAGHAGTTGLNRACFCTWEELREMHGSGMVHVACHSASHQDLTGPGADLDREIRGAGQCIAEHLGRFPVTFVFPLGRVNRRVNRIAAERYPYRMRIGAALNKGWTNRDGILCRLQCDNLQTPQGPLAALWRPRLKYFLNVLRSG